jgi:hypothetical protein
MKILNLLENPKKLLNYLSILVVFLNFTNAYLMLSGLLSIPFTLLSYLMMSILALNVVVYRSVVLKIISERKIFIFYIIIFCVIPALGVFLSPYTMIRYIGYNILSALLLLNVVIFIHQEGFRVFKKLVFFSFITTLAGLLVSYIAPELFRKIANLQASAMNSYGVLDVVKVSSAEHARAFGFYMQPNVAYTGILFHLYILITAYFNTNFLGRLFLYISAFGAILLTGSRGGFVMFFLFVMIIFISEVKNGCRDKFNRKVSLLKFVPSYLILGFSLSLIVIALMVFGKGSTADEGFNVVQKITSTFFPSQSGYGVSNDISVLSRFDAQIVYLERIFGDFFGLIFGNGTGAAKYYRYFGEIPTASHNNFLEMTFAHGIVVSLCMYGFFIFLTASKKSKQFFYAHGYNISWIITVCMFIQSFTINVLFNYRLLPILVGFWLMSLFFPKPDIPNYN